MKLSYLIEQLIYGVQMGLINKSEAFDQLIKYQAGVTFKLPPIPKNAEDKNEIETFIELAKSISAKYST